MIWKSKKKKIRRQNILKKYGIISKCVTYTQLVYEEKRETGTEKIFEVILAEIFPKLMTANHRFRKLRENQE